MTTRQHPTVLITFSSMPFLYQLLFLCPSFSLLYSSSRLHSSIKNFARTLPCKNVNTFWQDFIFNGRHMCYGPIASPFYTLGDYQQRIFISFIFVLACLQHTSSSLVFCPISFLLCLSLWVLSHFLRCSKHSNVVQYQALKQKSRLGKERSHHHDQHWLPPVTSESQEWEEKEDGNKHHTKQKKMMNRVPGWKRKQEWELTWE